MSIESVMLSNNLILCRPLLLPPLIFSTIRVFSNESVLRIRWPKYWSFSHSIRPSNEYSGLISFWMDWLDLLAVQGTLKSLLQHHSSWYLVHAYVICLSQICKGLCCTQSVRGAGWLSLICLTEVAPKVLSLLHVAWAMRGWGIYWRKPCWL